MKLLEFILIAYLAVFWCVLALIYFVVSLPIFLFSGFQGKLLPAFPLTISADDFVISEARVAEPKHLQ